MYKLVAFLTYLQTFKYVWEQLNKAKFILAYVNIYIIHTLYSMCVQVTLSLTILYTFLGVL